MVDFDTGSSESSHISAWNETQVLTTKSSQKSGFNMLKPASQPKNVAAGDTALFTVPAVSILSIWVKQKVTISTASKHSRN